VVHLYGHPAAMDPILDLDRRHSLFVVEDAAKHTARRIAGRPYELLAILPHSVSSVTSFLAPVKVAWYSRMTKLSIRAHGFYAGKEWILAADIRFL
jgi:hypothetical protein